MRIRVSRLLVLDDYCVDAMHALADRRLCDFHFQISEI